MPFTKIKSGENKGKYKSAYGRIYTENQIKMYYSTSGWKKKSKKRISKKIKKNYS
tara:strand:- start:518 stop:682 length:165 start_codon:yes stop_codon:yes gene_type:complete